jgi:hypothetical protein
MKLIVMKDSRKQYDIFKHNTYTYTKSLENQQYGTHVSKIEKKAGLKIVNLQLPNEAPLRRCTDI